MKRFELAELIRETISHEDNHNGFVTPYRHPVIGFVDADDPDFAHLSEWTAYDHLMPYDLLPGARSVVCFFLPFAPEISHANKQGKEKVAREWAIAYQDTNALIGQITSRLIDLLNKYGIHAAAEPAKSA